VKEHYDFSKGRRKNYAQEIREKGYSVIRHYSPEDVASGEFDDSKDIVAALVELMSKEETMRLLAHIKENYSLPCSPNVWHCLEVK